MKKILLITGASSEVGIALLQTVYEDYERIYLQYRTMNKALQDTVAGLSKRVELILLEADFTKAESVENMIQEIRESGILPNHVVHFPAPKAYNRQFHKDKWENYELGWEISVHSIVLLLQEFMKDMVKDRYGRIVFMLTGNTQNLPAKYQAGYVTVKYALLGLMKALAVEYINRGITVNGVSPDMTETKFLSELPELIIEKNREKSPLGRNIYIEEIVPVIKLLLSDSGASITGQNIGITGGL